MKFIIFVMFGIFTSIVHAEECRLPFKDPNSSILSLFKSSAPNRELEVPDGKCKLLKNEVLSDYGTCKDAHEAMISANPNLEKKYNCYQSAIGTSRGVDNGVPYSSYYAVCYFCKSARPTD